MAEIINLRRAKKNLARQEADKKADANRVKFGRNKVEKKLSEFDKERNAKIHQGHKLDK